MSYICYDNSRAYNENGESFENAILIDLEVQVFSLASNHGIVLWVFVVFHPPPPWVDKHMSTPLKFGAKSTTEVLDGAVGKI